MSDLHRLYVEISCERGDSSGRQIRRRKRVHRLLQSCDGRLQFSAADLNLKVAGVVEIGRINVVRHRDTSMPEQLT